MKNIIKNIYLILPLLVVFTSCEDYLDINDDPNNATEAPLTGLMARVSFETGDNTQNVGAITSFYVQYLASPNEASATDVQEPVAYDQTWFELYDVMTDINDMNILARELNATSYLAVGKILKAYNLGLTVDLWGDIPYTDAFFAQTLNPSYDDSQILYDTIQNLLSDGISILANDSSAIQLGEDDFIFQGDLDKWIKTAHALKARYFLHLSKTGQFSANDVLTQTALSYTINDDNASVMYFEDFINPWASVAINNSNLLLGGWISEQLVETMDGSSFNVVDPRMPLMFGTTDEGTYVGTVNGAGRGDASEQGDRSTLVTDTYYASRTSEINLITFSEVKFIEAEANLRAGNPVEAQLAYIEGIRAHFDQLGASDSLTNAYLNDPSVSVAATNLTLELIFKEKYIALFLNPEAWTDARRFDYQYRDFEAPVNLNPELGGELIRRVIYPESETGRNGENTPTVQLTTRLWWDQ